MSWARTRPRAVAIVLLFLVVASPLRAQADTIRPPRPLFTWRDGVLAGFFTLTTLAARPLDKYFAEVLQSPQRQESRFLQKTAKIVNVIAVPGSLVVGGSMYAVGRITKSHKMADLGLHSTEALLIGEGVGTVMKGVFGRQRPYVDPNHLNPDNWKLMRGFGKDDGYRSFPSGHAVAAFSAAAAAAAETSRWWPSTRWLIGPVMYGGAAMVGASRMYNNRHWASDVLVGAAIGTFAGTKVVRYQHSHPGTRIDEWLVNFSVVPSGTGHSLSASIIPRLGPGIPRQQR